MMPHCASRLTFDPHPPCPGRHGPSPASTSSLCFDHNQGVQLDTPTPTSPYRSIGYGGVVEVFLPHPLHHCTEGAAIERPLTFPAPQRPWELAGR